MKPLSTAAAAAAARNNLVLSSLLLLLLPSRSLSLSVLVPLYNYPTPGAWTPVTDAIASAPAVLFSVIINPDSGPGSYPPDQAYAAGVANLTRFPNVQLLGYVDTAFGSVSTANIQAQLDTYARWDAYPSATIGIDGVFFDDVSVDGGAGTESYLSGISAYAKKVLAPCRDAVALNPGVYAPASYFTFADVVVEFEDSFAKLGDARAVVGGIPAAERAQSAVIVNKVPQGQVSTMNSYIEYMGQSGIGWVYYTPDGTYNDLSEMASLVAGVQAAAGS